MKYQDLVDLDAGSIHRDVFDSDEVYQREQRAVFGGSWLFLAHESQLRLPGDFTTTFMGQDPIVVSRHTDGTVRAFLNVCRHRGMRVCRADEGNTKRFTCSYHGWGYDTTGALVDVPLERETFSESFDRSRLPLIAVPRIAHHKGLIFGTWNLDAPSLDDYLGDALHFLDPLLQPGEEGSELVGPMKWRLKGNWKLAAEQFSGDSYHAMSAHLSAIAALMPADAGQEGSASPVGVDGRMVMTAEGHSNGYVGDPDALRFQVGEELLDHAVEAGTPTLSSQSPKRFTAGGGTIFPNFSHLGPLRAFRVWHPRGPREMEIWSWVLVGKDWPDSVKSAMIKTSLQSFSTSGIFETDDSENWSEIAAVGGLITQAVPFDYGMRREPVERPDHLFPELRASSAPMLSDEPALNFYRRWAQVMDGPDPRLPDIMSGIKAGA